jgi:hypothetical protein
MRIFLSHASEDREKAEEIALALEGEGHDVFFDRTDLESGADYNAVIRKRVADADLFLFLITPASIDEGSYTLTELRMAREKWAHPKERVIPIMLEPTPLDLLPAYVRAVTVLDPEGDFVAEVAAHVSRRSRMRRAGWAGLLLAAVLAGGVTGFAMLKLFNQSASMLGDPPLPLLEPVWTARAEDFVTRHVYPPDIVERLEYALDPTSDFPAGTDDLVQVRRIAFGTLADTVVATGITVVLANTTTEPVQLDITHRFFELEDDQGRKAQLVFFCCTAQGILLGPRQEREVQLIFLNPPGWSGKETRARQIYFRVNRLLPVTRATWVFPPLATAA